MGARGDAQPGAEDGQQSLFDASREDPVYSVGQLTQSVKERLGGLGKLAVEGELSELSTPRSGHVYFKLKEEGAVLACAVWRSGVRRAFAFEPKEGMQVVAHGRLDVYAPRGSYSLIVERVEQRGIGALLAQLEALKLELPERRWFARARPLPGLPECVGIVTSRDGAALRDFLRTRSLRWPLYPVRLAHAPVQGPGSARAIADAIQRLDASGVSMIVVARGGGSLEDLWAFNELPVAEAIWNCSVPVLSGVGHETDFSLADLVADQRAHTPTDAAQTAIPERAAYVTRALRAGGMLVDAMESLLARRGERLERTARARVLRDPRWILADRGAALEQRARRLRGELETRLEGGARRVLSSGARLERQSPRQRLARDAGRVERVGRRLLAQAETRLEAASRRLALAARGLDAGSPVAVLGRGYSLARVRGEAALLRDVADVRVGDTLETQLHAGSILSEVTEVVRAPEGDPS